MKKFLPIILITLLSIIYNRLSAQHAVSPGPLPGLTTINASDTVVFDLTQATIVGTDVEFPVFILTDDTINALDFSLRYNHANLLYDTILNQTGYMQVLSYYNTNDSTIRFTSNSLTQYANATPLVKIRFNMLTAQMLSSDLNTLKGYLNGTTCSVKLVGTIVAGIHALLDIAVQVYPNPSSGFFSIASEKIIRELAIYSISGEQVYMNAHENSKSINFDLGNYENGVYFLKATTDDGHFMQKVVVSH